MAFTIEKGLQIPATPHRSGLAAALRAMEVGDSVMVPGKKPSALGAQIANIRNQPDMQDRKYTTRTVDGGVRIWRIQ